MAIWRRFPEPTELLATRIYTRLALHVRVLDSNHGRRLDFSSPSVANMTGLHNASSKEDIQNVEKIERDLGSTSGLSQEDEDFLATFSPEREKVVYRKVGHHSRKWWGATDLTLSRSTGA